MSFFLNKLKNYGLNKGMTYVELIVVLGIFSVMSAVVVFNYGTFQSKVDIKNLANDLALKIVEAQKAAIFGKFPSLAQQASITSTWKPSYGIYFNLNTDNKSFIYFTDLQSPQPQNNIFDGTDCTVECVEKISITKGNYISNISVFYQGDVTPYSLNDVTLSFKRPDAVAVVKSSSPLNPNISYVQITVLSPKGLSSTIKVDVSGRIQVN